MCIRYVFDSAMKPVPMTYFASVAKVCPCFHERSEARLSQWGVDFLWAEEETCLGLGTSSVVDNRQAPRFRQ